MEGLAMAAFGFIIVLVIGFVLGTFTGFSLALTSALSKALNVTLQNMSVIMKLLQQQNDDEESYLDLADRIQNWKQQ
jgi:hypothetical protein